MRRRFLWLGFAMAILSALGLALPATAGGVVSASSFTGTAIEGYDPVAYFTEGHRWKARAGSRTIGWTPPGTLRAPRTATSSPPTRTGTRPSTAATARGRSPAATPPRSIRRPGRSWTASVYLNYSKDVQAQWAEDIPGNIAKGDANWPKIRADLAG